jgi:uncharacterized protein (TIGR04255 family)
MICFPNREDVRLERAPLAEVICQVRFPPILQIANESPIAFQERIRKRFPQLEVEKGSAFRYTWDTEPQSAIVDAPVFRFKSADGNTVVTLTSNFYALSTTVYTHWADFLEYFQLVNQAAQVYELPYATRVGLRYINKLTFDNTGASSVQELLDILRPEMTVLLTSDCWDEPVEAVNQVLLASDGDEQLGLRSGFHGGDRPFFLLDLDYYAEGAIPLDDLSTLCNHYHDVIYNAFRWCIKDDKLTVFTLA